MKSFQIRLRISVHQPAKLAMRLLLQRSGMTVARLYSVNEKPGEIHHHKEGGKRDTKGKKGENEGDGLSEISEYNLREH